MRDSTKDCFYHLNYSEDGCNLCLECSLEHCPVAVSRMTDDEKAFYGVPKENWFPNVTCKACEHFYKTNGDDYAHCHCKENKPCEANNKL